MPRAASALAALLLATAAPAAGRVQHGLRVPDGFEVTEFAGSDLANDIYTMTTDPRGRVVVSGRGYVRILADDNGDGKADRAIPFADGPKDGAMGLLWVENMLYFTGDGGLRRYRDENGDDRADGPSELLRAMKTGGEHHAHAIRRGPGGWIYVLCGNSTGIDASFATMPSSPIRKPVAGCVLRFSEDFKECEIIADGFRNPYDMDFNPDGELFTYDSDNERCVSLPWYEGTRFYHVIPGGHHGWQSPQRGQFWRMPPYFPDVVAPVADLGRGSPTGCVCYRHAQFPKEYRGGFFLGDWTFGRVWFAPLEPKGSSYASKPRVFLESVGDNGFAPTALAVHPKTGDLFVSVGGRGTRGTVYRVRYAAGLGRAEPEEVERLQPRLRGFCGHAIIPTIREEVRSNDATTRLRALKMLEQAADVFSTADLHEIIRASWDHPDRQVRKAAVGLLHTLRRADRSSLVGKARTPAAVAACALAVGAEAPYHTIDVIAPIVEDKGTRLDARLTALRAIQDLLGGISDKATHGTVWEGYSARGSALGRESLEGPVIKALRAAFPSGHADLDRELSRTLAMIEDEDAALPARILDLITSKSSPVEDIHYLIVLARLRGPLTDKMVKYAAGALLALDSKIASANLTRDRNWPLRVGEIHAELARKHPAFNAALLSHPEFGRADHALFARAAGFDRRRAAEVFLDRAIKDRNYHWTPAVVEVVAGLPDERTRPVWRSLWGRGGLEEALLPLLARRPEPADRDKFVGGLRSPQPAMVRVCLDALEKLPAPNNGNDFLVILRCLRGQPEGKEGDALRERLGKYLERVTGQHGLGADRPRWSAWFAKTYPELAPRLEGADGVDVAAWGKRLSAVAWSKGDAARGAAVYQKASCAACHTGGQALGPDLSGVAGRFSRDDLFTAILQPSKDISPRYRTTSVSLSDGKTYQGLVIYEATDSLLLQTGPASTVRVPADKIEAKRTSDTSLMPAGLLDRITDSEIADLYAHLRALK